MGTRHGEADLIDVHPAPRFAEVQRRREARNPVHIGVGGHCWRREDDTRESFVPLLINHEHSSVVITNDIFTQEDAERMRRTLAGVPDCGQVVRREAGS
jgi:urease accessory protein